MSQSSYFFVYIVESPSAVDIYHGRGERGMLEHAVSLNRIQSMSRVVISEEALRAALSIGLAEAMEKHQNLLPLLHISAHGDSEGIELSNGDQVPWYELRDMLKPANAALGGKLLVCMSCCQGYAGIRMAMYPNETELPYLALVGNAQSPTWADTAVAYATFYHRIARGDNIVAAVSAMRSASGNDSFFLESAAQSRQAYIEYLQSLNPVEVQGALREEAQQSSPDTLAKLTVFNPGSDATKKRGATGR